MSDPVTTFHMKFTTDFDITYIKLEISVLLYYKPENVPTRLRVDGGNKNPAHLVTETPISS